MKRLLGILTIMLLATWVAADDHVDDEAEVRAFIEDFFTGFRALNPMMQPDDKKQMAGLTVHVVKNFTKVSEENRRSGRVPPVDLVSALFIHGPKNWQIKDMRVSGDVARVDMLFQSVAKNGAPDVPLSFRLIRDAEDWKFIRFINPRPKKKAVESEALPEQNAAASAETTVKTYLDFVVGAYNPDRAGAAQSRLADISKAITPLWLDTRAARRASGQLQAQLSQIQPLDWKLFKVDQGASSAEVTAELLVGNKLMLGNPMMLKMFGGETPRLTFALKKEGEAWKLAGFTRASVEGGQ